MKQWRCSNILLTEERMQKKTILDFDLVTVGQINTNLNFYLLIFFCGSFQQLNFHKESKTQLVETRISQLHLFSGWSVLCKDNNNQSCLRNHGMNVFRFCNTSKLILFPLQEQGKTNFHPTQFN